MSAQKTGEISQAAFSGQSKDQFAKTQDALRNCGKLLTFLITHKDSGPFVEPVNWKEWGLLDYPKIIKTPMDLNLVKVSFSYSFIPFNLLI
jgi:hypothetical protein